MVYQLAKFEESPSGARLRQEPRSSREPSRSLQRGGLWRIDEILPAAVDDLLSSFAGGSAAGGMAERADVAAAVTDLPGGPQPSWSEAAVLNPIVVGSHDSASIGGAVSVF